MIDELEFERDSDLRHWEIYAPSNDRSNGFVYFENSDGCRLTISDKLIRKLCFLHCHPFKTWQEWKQKEEELEKRVLPRP